MSDVTSELDAETRERLFRFCCAMAWADLEIQDEEQDYLFNLIQRLELTDAQRGRVAHWLKVPPTVEELDPDDIPLQHRQLFLDECEAIIEADGRVDDDETTFYQLFEAILFPERYAND